MSDGEYRKSGDWLGAIVHAVRRANGAADGELPLHAPVFCGAEREYLLDAVDSTYVSSVSRWVDRFEARLREITGARYVVATNTGTAALHTALIAAGVKRGDLVLTQAISFVATANAISYCGADPVFIDVEEGTLGLSPGALGDFLERRCGQVGGVCVERESGRRVSVCVPVHTLGHPCDIEGVTELCSARGIATIEDAAEALGSRSRSGHCGTCGLAGVLSFNGNKIVTSGGGGAVITSDRIVAERVRHLSTTARVHRSWEFDHDELGYNYRLPGLNAALGYAQLERLEYFVSEKRSLADRYGGLFEKLPVEFFREPRGGRSNYWLNAISLSNKDERDRLLAFSNERGVAARPLWRPLPSLPMYRQCINDGFPNATRLAERMVNIPSGVRLPSTTG